MTRALPPNAPKLGWLKNPGANGGGTLHVLARQQTRDVRRRRRLKSNALPTATTHLLETSYKKAQSFQAKLAAETFVASRDRMLLVRD
jgi:hypothetical protein